MDERVERRKERWRSKEEMCVREKKKEEKKDSWTPTGVVLSPSDSSQRLLSRSNFFDPRTLRHCRPTFPTMISFSSLYRRA